MKWDRQISCNGSYRGRNIFLTSIESGTGQTDPLMEGYKFYKYTNGNYGDGIL